MRNIADTPMIRELQDYVDRCRSGPERDAAQRKLDKFVARLRALPGRVALQGPFADRDEAHGVLTEEITRVIAAIDEDD
jgi:hypothetical protein